MRIPDNPPNIENILKELRETDPSLLLKLIESPQLLDSHGVYRHWDKLKYIELPEGIQNHEIWWIMLKIARKSSYRQLPIRGMYHTPFKFIMLDSFSELTHYLDQIASGNISVKKPIINPQMKNYYIINSLMEESITSSQMEGAVTTRDIAKKMLQEGRSPRNRSEQMIVNNYEAIMQLKNYTDERLTPELIMTIHRIITRNTLDNEQKCGMYRDGDDDIHVIADNDTIIFSPPKHSEIETRINQLCVFANEEDSELFIHPIIRAVILHFLLSYIHPFVDGNGRTARALFYWMMLKKGYWLSEFISISRILKQSPSQYARSFLYTESDENDLTYFIDYQLSVIRKAVDDLQEYVKRKMAQTASLENMLMSSKLSGRLNIRQRVFLQKAIRSPGTIYSIQEYMNIHQVVYQTARKDLLELSDSFNLLIKVKERKSFMFIVPSDLKERL